VPMAVHPLVEQLRFTRSEFRSAFRTVSDDDARRRIEPMNCISWNIGHLAWQEQRYFVTFAQGETPYPDIAEEFQVGAPASQPELARVVEVWSAVTAAADRWLDTVDAESLAERVVSRGRPTARVYGNLLQRTIYHYWYHTGETMAIRQLLGHGRLPQFVGNIDDRAPYRPA
jgi:uncharacterized damage-inducible protein DinB